MSYMKLTPSNPQMHFPHLFLIDGDGMIRNDFEGDKEPVTVESLSKEIDKLLHPTKGT